MMDLILAFLKLSLALSWYYYLNNFPIVGIGAWFLTGVVLGFLAKRKNRNVFLWGFVGGFFWGFSLVLLAFLPKRVGTEQGAKKANTMG